MFSLVTDASKVALAALVEMLRKGGFSLLDTQFLTDHLQQFGTIEIGRQEYLTLLEGAVRENVRFPGATGLSTGTRRHHSMCDRRCALHHSAAFSLQHPLANAGVLWYITREWFQRSSAGFPKEHFFNDHVP